MSSVQLDDYYCPHCKKTGMGELNVKASKYSCLMCGKEE